MEIIETILVGWGFCGLVALIIICYSAIFSDYRFKLNKKQIAFLVFIFGPMVWAMMGAFLTIYYGIFTPVICVLKKLED